MFLARVSMMGKDNNSRKLKQLKFQQVFYLRSKIRQKVEKGTNAKYQITDWKTALFPHLQLLHIEISRFILFFLKIFFLHSYLSHLFILFSSGARVFWMARRQLGIINIFLIGHVFEEKLCEERLYEERLYEERLCKDRLCEKRICEEGLCEEKLCNMVIF